MDLLTEFCKSPDARCPKCGYSLTGLTTGVCPECGEKLCLSLSGMPAYPRTVVGLAVVFLLGNAAWGGWSVWELWQLLLFTGDPSWASHPANWIRAIVCSTLTVGAVGGIVVWLVLRRRDRARAARWVVPFAVACAMMGLISESIPYLYAVIYYNW